MVAKGIEWCVKGANRLWVGRILYMEIVVGQQWVGLGERWSEATGF